MSEEAVSPKTGKHLGKVVLGALGMNSIWVSVNRLALGSRTTYSLHGEGQRSETKGQS